jgi:hypothetical protein
MTIGSTAPRVRFTCDGVSTVFPVAIQAYQATDFQAIHTTAAGVQTPMTLNSDYSLVAGGTLSPQQWTLTTLTGAYPSGDTIQIFINPVQTQQTAYVQGQAFPSPAVQSNMDRLTQMVQRLQDQINRAVIAPDGDVSPGMLLPQATQRISQYLATDANGNIITTAALPGTANTQASLGSILYPRTPAEIAAGVTPTNLIYPPGDIRRYGGVGDGATDSTTALINWAKSTAPGLELTLQPGGLYMITPAVTGVHNILFDSKTNFKVSGNGATIKVVNGGVVTANNEILFIRNCQDYLFEHLTIDGNIANRTPAISTTSNIDCRGDNSTGLGANIRGTFRKVRSINAVLDGIAIQSATESVQSSYPTDILFEDCEFNNAWRNGVSVVASVRCTFRGGRAINCGTTASGTAPRDGIDVEPNTTTTFANTDLLIDGMEFSGNAGFGLSLGGSVVNNTRLVVRNLRGNTNVLGFLNISNATDLEVDGALVGTHPNTSRGIIDINTGSLTDIAIRNISFAPQPSLSASQYLIFDQGNVGGRLMIDGVKAYNVTSHGIQTSSDASIENVDIKTITQDAVLALGGVASLRNVTVDGCSLRGFYTNQPVEVDGLTLIDCASTTASAQFDTGSTGAVVRNVLVKQRTAIPGGAVGLFFNVAPAVVHNVKCVSAGTDYTTANSINFAGGTSGTQTRGLSPNPFSGTATVAPGALANGASTNGTLTITGAALGDKVTAGPGADSQGMTFSASVSAANTVRWVISNTSGVGLTWASSTWNFSIDKG